MAKVLAECSVSCQMTNEDWKLKRAAKIFNDSNTILDIRKWYESVGPVKTDLRIYLFNEDDE